MNKMIMKNNIYIIAITLLSAFFYACDDKVDDVKFDVSADQTTVKAGDIVTFDFNGNPNHIMFYSGEPDSEYKHRTRTEVDVVDIERVELEFYAEMKWGPAPPAQPEYPLSIYISKEFEGLLKNDAEADALLIEDFKKGAKNYTQEIGMPANNGSKGDLKIDVTDYVDNFVLGYHFVGNKETTQRTATISSMRITSFLKNGKQTVIALPANLGFTALDLSEFLPDVSKGNRYFTGNANGCWNLTNIALNTFSFAGGGAGSHANNDWLVSTPMKLNLCVPDKGASIKNIATALNSYSYKFENAGTYEVTFVAGNTNYKGDKEVVKTVTIVVEENE